jgi:hypothetical protein
MSKGLPRSRSRGLPTLNPIIKKTFVAKGLPLVIDGATGVGFGSCVLGGFPEGNLLVLGMVGYLAVTTEETVGIVDDWEGDFGIGTTPADDATISGADVDLIASAALDAGASDKDIERFRIASAVALTGTIFDNTAGDLEMNFNMLVDDDDISADGIDFVVDGEVTILFSVLSDD